jgi:hypothetical protein
MDLDDLKEQLATLGPDLSRWPKAEADAAVALMAGSVEAQDLFAAATAEEMAIFDEDETPSESAA